MPVRETQVLFYFIFNRLRYYRWLDRGESLLTQFQPGTTLQARDLVLLKNKLKIY